MQLKQSWRQNMRDKAWAILDGLLSVGVILLAILGAVCGIVFLAMYLVYAGILAIIIAIVRNAFAVAVAVFAIILLHYMMNP